MAAMHQMVLAIWLYREGFPSCTATKQHTMGAADNRLTQPQALDKKAPVAMVRLGWVVAASSCPSEVSVHCQLKLCGARLNLQDSHPRIAQLQHHAKAQQTQLQQKVRGRRLRQRD